MTLLLQAILQAGAASLDQLEVGGPMGSPAADNATAVFWNPAGLGRLDGTQVHLEGAPTFARVQVDRSDPNGGPDTYARQAVIPFAAVASDFGLDFAGAGLALAVPIAKAASETDPPGTGSFAMREGSVQSVYFLLSGGLRPIEAISFGGSVAMVRTEWATVVDSESLSTLYDRLLAEGQSPDYTDALFETEGYTNTARLGPLTDTWWTGSAGVDVQVTERVRVAATWLAGLSVQAKGGGTYHLGCPPEDDEIGRFAIESIGLCDANLDVGAGAYFDLPHRINAGVAVELDTVRLEAMGGWVGWSAYDDIVVAFDEVAERNPDVPEEGAEAVEVSRVRARDAKDTWWAGLDAKGQVGPVMLGGRVVFDHHAIPEAALAPNNFDTDTWLLSGLVAKEVLPSLQVGLSGTYWLLMPRTVEDSAFYVTLDANERAPERYNYPHTAGSYRASVVRLGLSATLKL